MPTSTATASPRRAERRAASCAALALLGVGSAGAGEWTGDVGLDYRRFVQEAPAPAVDDANASLFFAPEYFQDWDNDRQRVVFAPFLRLDHGDAERSHFDLREFYWRRSFAAAELFVGLRRVFWGVTESVHLVDIVNQTDLVENLDTEDKLGQPMIALRLLRDWGTLDLYALPYFRERTFPGPQGRLRGPLPIDESGARYESGAEQRHIDYAVRWSHYFGAWDVGIAHFAGTGREPQLLSTLRPGAAPALVPYYPQVHQTSVDLQATLADWLLKLELFHRTGDGPSFQALAAGFEYTLVGIAGSAIDFGLIAEYLRDNRTRGATLFDDDIAFGLRFAFNDIQGSELLAFAGVDLDTRERFTSIEGSRRIGQSWRVRVEGRFFSNPASGSLLDAIARDDYLELSLARYF